LHGATFEAGDEFVFARVGNIGKRFAAERSPTVPIQCSQRLAIVLRGRVRRLFPLRFRAFEEWAAAVESFGPAVSAGELAIDEDGAANVFAPRGLGVGWNEAIDQRLDSPRFVGREKLPRPGPCGVRGIC
jgi:hypothetical protein